MSKRMLVFDFKKSEKEFFDTHEFKDYDIEFFEQSLNPSTLSLVSDEDRKNAEIISVFVSSQVDKGVIDSFESLKIIATRSTGYNQIDIDRCCERKIAVVNVSNYGKNTVVQYTIGLMLTLIRNIIPAVVDMRGVSFNADDYIGRDLNALKLGVIGTGAIGADVCKIASAIGMQILAYDLYPKDNLKDEYGVKYVDFETLVKESDVITLHAPYTEESYHMLSHKEFEMMKQDAYIINTARGELVDTQALYKALVEKKIKGVAFDVVECENFSLASDDLLEKIPSTSPNCLARTIMIQKMIEMPNVIITPHIAYNTKDAVENLLTTTFASLDAFFKGERINRVI